MLSGRRMIFCSILYHARINTMWFYLSQAPKLTSYLHLATDK